MYIYSSEACWCLCISEYVTACQCLCECPLWSDVTVLLHSMGFNATYQDDFACVCVCVQSGLIFSFLHTVLLKDTLCTQERQNSYFKKQIVWL